MSWIVDSDRLRRGEVRSGRVRMGILEEKRPLIRRGERLAFADDGREHVTSFRPPRTVPSRVYFPVFMRYAA